MNRSDRHSPAPTGRNRAEILNAFRRNRALPYFFLFILLGLIEPKRWCCFAANRSSDDSLFAAGAIRTIRIDLPDSQLAALRRKPRHNVRATIREGSMEFRAVGVHLKGSTGSFLPIDQKPSFTLNFKQFGTNQGFHGLHKIHLNNSIEDPAYVNEKIGSELFNAAGIPAPRVTRALVELNGRALGLYVLKEGFDDDFLDSHFHTRKGALYEPVGGGDIDGRMTRRAGNQSDPDPFCLFRSAINEQDLEKKWTLIEKSVDVDEFLTFMALEVILCHRDGYSIARNNFRLYHDPSTQRALLLPYGMDQLFGIPDLAWNSHFGGTLARAVMENVETRQKYRARLDAVFDKYFIVNELTTRVRDAAAELTPFLRQTELASVRNASELVCTRIAARASSLNAQLNLAELSLLHFDRGIAALVDWLPTDAATALLIDQPLLRNGHRSLHIVAEPGTTASWRTQVILEQGKYSLESSARISGVKSKTFGRNQGAGLRVINTESGPYSFLGDSDWKVLRIDFSVEDKTKPVDLACELRADAGEVWFDLNSVHLTKQDK
ncbi:MAG: cotH 3 [Verrucomicrobiales bacterium]|nr:cotH 3 [Verrucomicrobiales bacterium]